MRWPLSFFWFVFRHGFDRTFHGSNRCIEASSRHTQPRAYAAVSGHALRFGHGDRCGPIGTGAGLGPRRPRPLGHRAKINFRNTNLGINVPIKSVGSATRATSQIPPPSMPQIHMEPTRTAASKKPINSQMTIMVKWILMGNIIDIRIDSKILTTNVGASRTAFGTTIQFRIRMAYRAAANRVYVFH